MDTALFTVFGHGITAWKLVGYAGTLLFTMRWVVQFVASRKAGRPTLPRLFWYMSVTGSLLLLSYFLFGKNDGPGIISNLFPLLMASYNLYLDFKNPSQPVEPTIGKPGESPAESV